VCMRERERERERDRERESDGEREREGGGRERGGIRERWNGRLRNVLIVSLKMKNTALIGSFLPSSYYVHLPLHA